MIGIGSIPRTRPRMVPFVIWALLALIFVGLHYPFYFQWFFYEGGDLAANAIQIKHAKALEELYGNYSRFGFHHPGPAFFYVYAAAERMLFDLLKVVPTPFAAHCLAGVLLQTGFFTWAICIVTKRIERPLLMPLLLLFGAFYFGVVNHFLPNAAFQSIWSPHVLLMPFLCFVVAAASFASRGTEDLVPLALAGSFLVHGHVAQPLFVIPLTLIAYGCWWIRQPAGAPRFSSATMRAHLWAGGIIALFLLPLLLDACKGERSNLALIIRHWINHAGDHKTLAQSALYYFTFLCHIGDPERFCDTLSASSFDFIRPRWFLLVMWVVVGAATTLLLRLTHRRGTLADPSFTRAVFIFFAAASGLTLVWGIVQSDALLEFNAHFNFAILFLVFVLLAIALASLPSLRSARILERGIFALSLPVMFLASRNFSSAPDFATQPPFTVELNDQIRAAAKNDRQPGRTKFLLFEDWGEAARVALALTRSRSPFRVSAGWEPVFGPKRGMKPTDAINNPKISIWKVKNASTGPGWLSTEIKTVDAGSSTISFSADGNVREFVTYGWELPRGEYSWSTAKSAILRFTAPPAPSDVEVMCDLEPVNGYQVMTMTFNGKASKAFEITGLTSVTLRVPAAIWNESTIGILEFGFPLAVSQPPVEGSTDPREVSCAFRAIRFEPAR